MQIILNLLKNRNSQLSLLTYTSTYTINQLAFIKKIAESRDLF